MIRLGPDLPSITPILLLVLNTYNHWFCEIYLFILSLSSSFIWILLHFNFQKWPIIFLSVNSLINQITFGFVDLFYSNLRKQNCDLARIQNTVKDHSLTTLDSYVGAVGSQIKQELLYKILHQIILILGTFLFHPPFLLIISRNISLWPH